MRRRGRPVMKVIRSGDVYVIDDLNDDWVGVYFQGSLGDYEPIAAHVHRETGRVYLPLRVRRSPTVRIPRTCAWLSMLHAFGPHRAVFTQQDISAMEQWLRSTVQHPEATYTPSEQRQSVRASSASVKMRNCQLVCAEVAVAHPCYIQCKLQRAVP
jgi:hypothetical protein